MHVSIMQLFYSAYIMKVGETRITRTHQVIS